ncbi:hypothetical protein OX284_004995 [Flavobacterium sp. SUN046]|nr:hypothetical protein [Flavobacterium sp. SUN046]MEC4048778.1 hypothetical protein [Flavobacterium sp. SUN046]
MNLRSKLPEDPTLKAIIKALRKLKQSQKDLHNTIKNFNPDGK